MLYRDIQAHVFVTNPSVLSELTRGLVGSLRRYLAAQEAAADAHWASCTSRRAFALWLFYAQQVRRLGIELPSPSTAPSSLHCSPRLPSAQAAEPHHAGGSWDAARGGSRGAVRSLVPSFAIPQRQHATAGSGPPEQHPPVSKSAKQLRSSGLLALSERLGEVLSPPRASSMHASRRTVGGFEQQQGEQQEESPMHPKADLVLASPRSISVPGVDASAPAARPSACAPAAGPRAGTTSTVRRSGAAAAGGSSAGTARGDAGQLYGVPLALQASFASVSRSHRLRRRWLLVKAFNRCACRGTQNVRLLSCVLKCRQTRGVCVLPNVVSSPVLLPPLE